MSANNNEYMLLFHGTDWHSSLSPEQMQNIAGEWMNWFNNLTAQGKCVGGAPLENAGKTVSQKGGRLVVDGPYAESKEAIGGYFTLRVDSIEEAVEIAGGCPGLPYGVRVEVRQVMEQCGLTSGKSLEAELAGAAA